jgi:hypothetical protein
VRLIVLGVDDAGQSCVASTTELAFTPIPNIPGVSHTSLYRTSESPPPPCPPPAQGKQIESTLPPGCVNWYIIDHEPPTEHETHAGTELHGRNMIDLVVVLEGGGALILADGEHPVTAGDCIVMAGIEHGMRTGPEGSRLMSFAIGASPQPA